jgi:hypothetical protein
MISSMPDHEMSCVLPTEPLVVPAGLIMRERLQAILHNALPPEDVELNKQLGMFQTRARVCVDEAGTVLRAAI